MAATVSSRPPSVSSTFCALRGGPDGFAARGAADHDCPGAQPWPTGGVCQQGASGACGCNALTSQARRVSRLARRASS